MALDKRSFLVQRLEPKRRTIFGEANPFAFGGGLVNGGLSAEARKLLPFEYDYMGAAEYEWGAVPEALQRIAKASADLAATSFEIELKDVQKHWRDKSRKAPTGSAEVFLICRLDDVEEIRERVRSWAAGAGRLRDSTNLDSVLRPNPTPDAYVPDTCGWLELDNGFFVFTDRDMWLKTAALFEAAVLEGV